MKCGNCDKNDIDPHCNECKQKMYGLRGVTTPIMTRDLWRIEIVLFNYARMVKIMNRHKESSMILTMRDRVLESLKHKDKE